MQHGGKSKCADDTFSNHQILYLIIHFVMRQSIKCVKTLNSSQLLGNPSVESQLCISHLQSGGCAQQERGSCPAIIKRTVSAGHVNCHGGAVCSTGQTEAGCSRCNLFIVCQLNSHRSMQQTNFLLLPWIKFSIVNKTFFFPPYKRCTTFLY